MSVEGHTLLNTFLYQEWKENLHTDRPNGSAFMRFMLLCLHLGLYLSLCRFCLKWRKVPANPRQHTTVCAHNGLDLKESVLSSGRDSVVFSVSFRHERIHTKRGSHMKTQTDPDEVDDLATLELLDEVRQSVYLNNITITLSHKERDNFIVPKNDWNSYV